MKKKSIKKQKAPAYIFGLTEGQMGAIGSSIGPVGNAVGSVGTSIGNAADDTSKAAVAGSAFSGLGQGAGIGSQIGGAIGGPEGQLIGAGIGAVGGLVGGIFAGRKKRQQALARERRAFQAKETQAGLDNQAQFEQEYWNDNGLAYSFENGGVLPNVAWVDNNEVLRDNNGNIVQVPNTKPGTDNHLINSTTLESVLSDKLKRPGTNKTFAQEGEKLAKMTKGSKGKDRFAQAADKLNKIHANAKYEQLLAEQAEVQAKKGIKPKMKGVAPAYETGIVKIPYAPNYPELSLDEKIALAGISLVDFMSQDYLKDHPDLVKYRQSAIDRAIRDKNYADKMTKPYSGQIPKDQLIALQEAANNAPVDGITGETIPVSDWGIYTDKIPRSWKDPIYDLHLRTTEDSRYHMMRNYATPGQYSWIGGNLESQVDALSNLNPNLNKPVGNGSKSVLKAATAPKKETTPEVRSTTPLETFGTKLNIPEGAKLDLTAPNRIPTELPTDTVKDKKSFDLSALGEVIPLAANMFAKPEYDSQVFNPYAGAINRAMARRRMNIEPTLAANRRSRAISNRNLANINSNTGANLAARTQAAVSEYAQNADVYATRDNANNQYLADAANMMNTLGQQFAQNAVYTNDLNARNRAAARNFRTKSIENYNNWYQNRQLMKNQKERDEALYPILSDFLQYGIKDEYLAGLNKKWGRNKQWQ